MATFANGYKYRRSITINSSQVSGGSNLTNFQLYINTTSALFKSAANGGNVVYNTAGVPDIRFELADGTKLDHEFDGRYIDPVINGSSWGYDPATGNVRAWIRIPTLLAASNTVIYMYYGKNIGSTSEENRLGVWPGYKLVVHEGYGPRDSSPNNYSLTSSAATLFGSGKVGNFHDFNGSSSLQGAPAAAAITGNGAFTCLVWARPDVVGSRAFYSWGANSTNNKHCLRMSNSNGGITHYFWANDTVTANLGLVGGFHHIVAGYDGTTIQIIVDGVVQASRATGGVNVSSTGITIGNSAGLSEYFDGGLDELWIYNGRLTNGHIATFFNNQNAPGSFYTVGVEIGLLDASLEGDSTLTVAPITIKYLGTDTLSGDSLLTAAPITIKYLGTAGMVGDSTLQAQLITIKFLQAALEGDSSLSAVLTLPGLLSAILEGDSSILASIHQNHIVGADLGGDSELSLDEWAVSIQALLSGDSSLSAVIQKIIPVTANLMGDSILEVGQFGILRYPTIKPDATVNPKYATIEIDRRNAAPKVEVKRIRPRI